MTVALGSVWRALDGLFPPEVALPRPRKAQPVGAPVRFSEANQARVVAAVARGAGREEAAKAGNCSKQLLFMRLAAGRNDPEGEWGDFARKMAEADAAWMEAKNAPGLKRRSTEGLDDQVAHIHRVLLASPADPAEIADLVAGATDEAGLTALKERALLECRRHLLPFLVYCYMGNRPFFMVNWHHRILADLFEQAARGEIRRLLISTPPRYGKTEVMRGMSAWLLGTSPDSRIIAGAYSSRLANKSSRAVQRVVASQAFRDVFPDVRLPDRREVLTGEHTRQAGEWELAGGFRGGYYASGLSGSVTGMGGGFILVDDPCKDRQEADSAVYQETVFERFTDDWTSRREQPDVQIVMATRWGERDLIGQLLAHAQSDDTADQWTVVNLPALLQDEADRHPDDPRELGDPLWPGIYLRPEEWEHPPNPEALAERARKDLLQQIAKTSGGEALYQGRPVSREGGLLKAEWFKERWTVLPNLPGTWLQSWDPKASSSKRPWASHTSGVVLFRPHGFSKVYLVDERYEQVGIDGAIRMLHSLTDAWPQCGEKIIERKGYGGTLLDLCKGPHAAGGVQYSGIPGLTDNVPRGDKITRLEAVTALISSGDLILPDPSVRPWAADFLRQLLRFSGKKTDQADRLDALTQGLDRFKLKSQPFRYESVQKRASNGFR